METRIQKDDTKTCGFQTAGFSCQSQPTGPSQFPTTVVFVTHYTLAPHPGLQRDHLCCHFCPLPSGATAKFEPLCEHLDDYKSHLARNFGNQNIEEGCEMASLSQGQYTKKR